MKDYSINIVKSKGCLHLKDRLRSLIILIRCKQIQRKYVAWYLYNIYIWCFSYDTAYGVIFNTSFTIVSKILSVEHSLKIYRILWRINEVKIWYAIKRRALLCKTYSAQRCDYLTWFLVHASLKQREELFAWGKDVH